MILGQPLLLAPGINANMAGPQRLAPVMQETG